MKKRTALLMILIITVIFCAAQADTDMEIQLPGHTFGETMEQSAHIQNALPTEIIFDEQPHTIRVVIDKIANWISWGLFDPCPLTITYSVDFGDIKVAGYNPWDAHLTQYYYFPTVEDSKAVNVKSGIFYAGTYGFGYTIDNNPIDVFRNLKGKLTRIYGEPSAEGTNGEELWGEITRAATASEEAWNDWIISRKDDSEYVIWNSTVNNAMIVLRYEPLGTNIYYVDKSADEKILALYEANKEESTASGEPGGL